MYLHDDSLLSMWESGLSANRHRHPAHRQGSQIPGAILCAPDPPGQLCPCASGADAQELEGIVSRAVRQAAQSLETAQVPEDVFWYAQQVGDTFPKHHFKAPCRLFL